MKERYILDAGVLAVYFAGREDAKPYVNTAYQKHSIVYMLEMNMAEFLYNYARVFGWDSAIVKHKLIRGSPIRIVGVDEDLTVEAARLKLKHYAFLSLADCYLLAAGEKLKATVVTTDSRIKEIGGKKVKLIEL